MTASSFNFAPLMMPLSSQEFLVLGSDENYTDFRHESGASAKLVNPERETVELLEVDLKLGKDF